MFQYFKMKGQVEKQKMALATKELEIRRLTAENAQLSSRLKCADAETQYFREMYAHEVKQPGAFQRGRMSSHHGDIWILEILSSKDDATDLIATAILAAGMIGVACLLHSLRRPKILPTNSKREPRYRIFDILAGKELIVTETELIKLLPERSEPIPM